MSNLTTSVKFDVLRGWPHGSAVEDSFPVKSGVTLYEGQIVNFDSTSSGTSPVLNVPASVGTAAAPLAGLRMVITGNDQFDGKFAKKAVVLRGEFTVKTEKFVAGSYKPGDALSYSIAAGTPGYLTAASTNQVVGVVEEYDSTAGTLTVAMTL